MALIEIDGIGATRRQCSEPAGVMEQEAEFFAALESAATYTVDGDFIELRNADDAIAVHMVRELDARFPRTWASRADRPRDRAEGVNIRSVRAPTSR